jgi:DNA-binding NarL/FixJ family response regulator
MNEIRVLLADDQELFIESLKIVLESRTPDIRVCGIAHDGRQAIRLAEETSPSVILLDVRMPVMNGVEAARIIRERHPAVRIVMLTTYDEDEYVTEALRYGAVGYLLKNMPPHELITSIRAVNNGIFQISPVVARKLMSAKGMETATTESIANTFPPEAKVSDLLKTLTPKERQILEYLKQAMDNKQIAKQVNLAEQTVKNNVHAIYAKLSISNRMQLIRLLNEIR